MKRIIALVGLSVVACGAQETIQEPVTIASPPPLVAGVQSGLKVPKSCPVYAPGGGDVDTPEAPFPDGVTIICAVDDQGGDYGVVGGDAPTARLAVIPGNREIGMYVGFKSGSKFAPDDVVGSGAGATINAWAAPTNVDSQDCCPENHPDKSIPIRIVALGTQGVLFSLGQYDSTAIQVAIELDGGLFSGGMQTDLTYWSRFYVNGPP